eukprot:scaffold60933_cov55-Attheya_sp.AAC.3
MSRCVFIKLTMLLSIHVLMTISSFSSKRGTALCRNSSNSSKHLTRDEDFKGLSFSKNSCVYPPVMRTAMPAWLIVGAAGK